MRTFSYWIQQCSTSTHNLDSENATRVLQAGQPPEQRDPLQATTCRHIAAHCTQRNADNVIAFESGHRAALCIFLLGSAVCSPSDILIHPEYSCTRVQLIMLAAPAGLEARPGLLDSSHVVSPPILWVNHVAEKNTGCHAI